MGTGREREREQEIDWRFIRLWRVERVNSWKCREGEGDREGEREHEEIDWRF